MQEHTCTWSGFCWRRCPGAEAEGKPSCCCLLRRPCTQALFSRLPTGSKPGTNTVTRTRYGSEYLHNDTCRGPSLIALTSCYAAVHGARLDSADLLCPVGSTMLCISGVYKQLAFQDPLIINFARATWPDHSGVTACIILQGQIQCMHLPSVWLKHCIQRWLQCTAYTEVYDSVRMSTVLTCGCSSCQDLLYEVILVQPAGSCPRSPPVKGKMRSSPDAPDHMGQWVQLGIPCGHTMWHVTCCSQL